MAMKSLNALTELLKRMTREFSNTLNEMLKGR